MKKVTLSQIAEACGVTKGAVSRALANKYNVSEETTYLIKQKAIELGYDFSKLRTNKNKKKHVAILCPSRLFFKENFWQQIVKTASSTLSRKGIKVDYFIFDEKDINKENLSNLNKKNYSGFMVVHYNNKEIMDVLIKSSLPVVVIDPKFNNSESTSVKFSNFDSMYKATQHLIDLGHKRIAYYGSDSHSVSFLERHNGYLSCIASNNLESCNILFDNTLRDYADNSLLNKVIKEFKPTALICANDIIALNAYKTINALGLNVPDDISVIGFDNVELSKNSYPSLSTFNIPLLEIGEEAAEYLTKVIEKNKISYSQVVIRCDYIERDSVKERK